MLALRATRTSQAVVRLCVRPQEVSRSVRHASTLDWNKVQSLQLDEKVVAFTKSYCPTCIDLLERLDDANVAVKNVELDKWENGNAIRDELRKVTGQEHVPFVYINGKHVPSATVVPGMKKGADGKEAGMKAVLTQAGVPVTGYFRT